jgi:histone deacetylase complex regulatory component SIN3
MTFLQLQIPWLEEYLNLYISVLKGDNLSLHEKGYENKKTFEYYREQYTVPSNIRLLQTLQIG